MADGASIDDALRALPTPERDALAVLALAYEPVALGEWTRLLARSGVFGRGAAPSPERMQRLCERGVRKGLLEEHVRRERRLYATTAAQALGHLEDAAHRGRLESLDRLVRDHRGGRGSSRYGGPSKSWERAGSALRVALVRGDRAAVADALASAPRDASREDRGTWLARTLGVDPRDDDWFDLLGDDGELYLGTLARGAVELLWPLGPVALRRAERSAETKTLAAMHLAMVGRGAEALAVERIGARDRFEVALATAFWAGRRDRAWEIGLDALDATGGKARALRGIVGVLHAIARVTAAHEHPEQWQALAEVIEGSAKPRLGFTSAYRCLEILRRAATGGEPPDVARLRQASGPLGALREDGWISPLTAGLVHAWLEVSPEPGLTEALEGWGARARRHGYGPVADELDALLAALGGAEAPHGNLAAAYRPRQPWEVALDALDVIAREPRDAGDQAPEGHVVWEVRFAGEEVDIRPRVVAGRARRGRPIALSRLLEGEGARLDARDRRVLAQVEYEEPTFFSKRKRRKPLLGPRALLALVDHPSVVDAEGRPLSLSRGEPGVAVRSTAQGLALTLQPPAIRDGEVAWAQTSPGHVLVYERTEAVARIAEVLADGRVEIPERGRERLGQVLGRLGERLPVQAAGDVPLESETREADPRPVVLLEWDGETLTARLRVAPLGLGGPRVQAGAGDARLASIVAGRALSTVRDLEAEAARAGALLDDCPTLAALGEEGGARRTDELAEALEVLLELAALGDQVVLAWPRGRELHTPVVRSSGALRARIKSARDWLRVDLSLPVDEARVLALSDLMSLPREGRFVRLEGSRFVALTRELEERLDALEGLGKLTKRGLEVSPALLPLLDELTEDADERRIDAAASERLRRLRELADRDYEVPPTFEGELRDYQREGYVWAMRLAEAGLGACLADDMGLGKTVQALALLVARAERGPALVIAPASVAMNWIDEGRRFAPTLTMRSLADGDRAEIVESLGPGDVLVCTYGLLVTEAERLAARRFDTLVLDEAHYLKNPRTKRARSARAIDATFRLALTGTPIENHLGELWSLMRATVPGLLGTKKRFEQRYGSIREGDRARAAQLRAVLRPFLLRRTKAQVLDELPPRTEITLRVTPTADERAFYEALRRRAVERLDEPGEAGRMQVLAEISRLRQAAIDPRLVDPDAGPPGAKLDALADRLLALREEGHRALVFSQFLESLARIRERLDAEGVRYLALEGSTSQKERAARIAAFQRGEADVFVMSLRAGGIGVNLTAADYVVHLDPWWNPAVEDQATGRAHRIGQPRPVTVYRMITQGTIEEKILALHRDKRELAEDLLSGMERAGALDLDELRALLEP